MNISGKKYDYLIVGAGFFGSVCAYELNKIGKKVLVIDKKSHIGGNCYSKLEDNINIHMYGPHIFHTSNEKVWEWINNFTEFNNFILSPIANYKGKLYNLPFNMNTFNQLWGVITPQEAIDKINSQKIKNDKPSNLEEQSLSIVGSDIYNILIKGYTEKQWRKPAIELPKEIINRLPVRFTYDNNYFNDKYQGIPIGGYTKIFENILKYIEVILDTDYLENKKYYDSITENIIYTGPIDKYFNYEYGRLEYKTSKFEHIKLENDNYQGCAIMNFTDSETPYTRIVEHKHFENSNSNYTWISKEYPIEFTEDTEPMYPVNNKINNDTYFKYKIKSEEITNTYFGGRLAEYKYYDMDKVIESALNMINKIKQNYNN